MDYEIIYSSRKTMSLGVKGGRLIIRAPYGTKQSTVDEAVSKHRRWIENAIGRTAKPNMMSDELTPCETARLREEARRVLGEKTAYFAEIMGLKYSKIVITGAKTRFGSCSAKGNISYSYRLMRYPEAAIDYVVVHELAHLVEMNHSPRFYEVVEKILPDYKSRRKLLKSM